MRALCPRGGDDTITVVVVYVANDKRVQPPMPVIEQETQRIELVDDEEIGFDPYATTVVPEDEQD